MAVLFDETKIGIIKSVIAFMIFAVRRVIEILPFFITPQITTLQTFNNVIGVFYIFSGAESIFF